MKTIKVLVMAALLISILGWTVGLEAKKKSSDENVALYLNDEKLEDPAYYVEKGVEAVTQLEKSLTFQKTSDMKTIQNYSSEAKIQAQAAEECASVALGYRQMYVKSAAEGKSLSVGNLGESGDAELSASVAKKIEDLKSGAVQLSDLQKAYFLNSIVNMTAAIVTQKTVVESSKMFVEEAGKATGMAKAKYAKDLPAASKIVSELPGTIASQLATLQNFLAIATTQNIEIPHDVTSKMNF